MKPVALSPHGLAARSAVRAGLARFLRDRNGVTTIEFAFVAVPFIALMFAILETALVFFAGQALETALGNAGRLVRTGQAQSNGMTAADFKSAICGQVYQLFDCDAGLKIDVRTFPTFDSVDVTAPKDEDGNFDPADFDFAIGEAGDIVLVRAYYEWPVFVPRLGNDLANLPNGKHLLGAAVAFKNEPFPW